MSRLGLAGVTLAALIPAFPAGSDGLLALALVITLGIAVDAALTGNLVRVAPPAGPARSAWWPRRSPIVTPRSSRCGIPQRLAVPGRAHRRWRLRQSDAGALVAPATVVLLLPPTPFLRSAGSTGLRVPRRAVPSS